MGTYLGLKMIIRCSTGTDQGNSYSSTRTSHPQLNLGGIPLTAALIVGGAEKKIRRVMEAAPALAICVVLVLSVAVQPSSAGAEENPLRFIRHERATILIGIYL